MKKILALIGIFLSGVSLTLAQTTTLPLIPPTTTVSQVDSLVVIAKNIDRRIAYFNKYIKARDITSIMGLISEENKDFYDNVIKYISSAPTFTIKRDTTQNIIKTPQDTYMFPAIMSLGGKDAKITMTFIEESVDANKKWAILDSNLHIVGKTLTPDQNVSTPKPQKGAITSSVLNKNTPPTPTNISQTSPALSDPGDIVPEEPVMVPKPTSPKIPTVVVPQSTAQTSIISSPIISIAIGITLLFGLLGGIFYYFMRKRKNIGKAILAAQAAVALSSLPLTDIPSSPEITRVEQVPALPLTDGSTESEDNKITPEQTESNVSLVEAEEPMTTVSPDSPEDIGVASSVGNTTASSSEMPLSESLSVPSDIPQDSPTSTSVPVVALSDDPTETTNDISVLSETSEAEQVLATHESLITSPGAKSTPLESAPSEPIKTEGSLFYSTPTSPANNLDPDPLFSQILSPESSSDTSSLFGNIL